MRKLIILILSLVFLSGCATYRFQHAESPNDKGFVVTRDNKIIPEYTAGQGDTFPDLKLARERFTRRRRMVEDLYKKMGVIEDRLKEESLDNVALFGKIVSGVFRLPAAALANYRYDHNAKYRERVRKLQEDQELKEQARIGKLKDKLAVYIQQDLNREDNARLQFQQPVVEKTESLPPKEAGKEVEVAKALTEIESGQVPSPALTPQEQPVPTLKPEPKARPKQKPPEQERQLAGQSIGAKIIAKPAKGYSPLLVHFSGGKSFSKTGRIISYYWEFGDGEASVKKNPLNTYWSVSYGSRFFTVRLTVNDDKGNTATDSIVIEVMNR